MSDLINIPRPEYPRPQFRRDSWQNLNGSWSFAFDPGNSGKERGWFRNSQSFPLQITVPFCPESRLSGIGQVDFHPAVWYHRSFNLNEAQIQGGVLLHFGAVDYHCEVWINEQPAGSHDGGFSSFALDISPWIQAGENTLAVLATDDLRGRRQPGGKQSARYGSYGCYYTRTTGIWQTVWLEFVPKCYIQALKIDADPDNQQILLTLKINCLSSGNLAGDWSVRAAIFDPADHARMAATTVKVCADHLQLMLQPDSQTTIKTWDPGRPYLYDLELDLLAAGLQVDHVDSYFGFRTLSLRPEGLFINNKPVFQRLILDQGFYPDGIYTAPTDGDLKRDIELAMALGFNGARLHQKVFEPRFLYWADRLGYLVWGEQASWGLDITTAEGLAAFLPEWLEILERDISHPSIIGWCPFNETWDYQGRRQDDRVLRQVWLATKAIDPTRPVIDTSGNYHVATDVFDIHDYEQDPDVFAAHYQKMREGLDPYVTFPDRQKYQGQPYFVSEYGGAWWSPGQKEGWGYGKNPASEIEFAERYSRLTRTLLDNPRICAFCYTQLTNVEQEQNGLYTYERKPKFSAEIYERIRQVNCALAAFEANARLS